MYKSLFLILFSWVTVTSIQAKITPADLRCEYLMNPGVVDVLKPRLSWVNIADKGERGQVQTAWEIRVASTRQGLLDSQADIWNSGKVISAQSSNVYGGKSLVSRQDCWWQVRTWDKNGKVSEWSEPAFWSMGLLKPEEWKAQWIGAPWQGEEALPKPARQSPGDAEAATKVLPPPAPLLAKVI